MGTDIIISVIIPTYREWQRIKKCIQAIESQTYPKNRFEVIIVNNDPSDPLPLDIELPSGFSLITESQPGSYAARNTGIKSARGEILAFLDGDCIPNKDWLKNGFDCFLDPSIHLVGGKVALHKEKEGSIIIYRYEKFTSFRQDINIPQGKALGGNLFVRSSVLLKCGTFNAELKSGGDWEFSARCVRNGYKLIYCELAQVSHPARHTLKDILIKQRRLVAWGVINAHNLYGQKKIIVVARQYKNGILKLFYSKLPKADYKDKLIIISIEFVKVHYRLWIGFLVILNLIDPKSIRK